MERARYRTLRLTIIIVLAFFWCWTPYVAMVLWYQLDPDGAEHVNGYLQSSLFMFAVSNSCVNPIVYGSYTTNFKALSAKLCRCWSSGNPPAIEHSPMSRRPSGKTFNSWNSKPAVVGNETRYPSTNSCCGTAISLQVDGRKCSKISSARGEPGKVRRDVTNDTIVFRKCGGSCVTLVNNNCSL